MNNMNDLKKLILVTTHGIIKFVGKYRRDLEKPNWHYYETENENIIHIRKEFFVAVLEGSDTIFTPHFC